MSDKIKAAYDADPTAGDNPLVDGYIAVGVGGTTKIGYSFDQLSDAVGVRLDAPSPSIVLSVFTATVDVDTIIADLIWGYAGTEDAVGWIVKEDDTDLPLVGDADWVSLEPQTHTLSNNNQHTLTARLKDASDNISNAITVTVTPTATTLPTIDTFTTINPSANSSDFTFSMTASVTGAASSIDYYLLVLDNDTTPPTVGDAGWIAWAGPYTNEGATLDAFEDTRVRAYVKDDLDGISIAASSVVSVSVGGDTAPNGDWLWENSPTVPAYTGTYDYVMTDGSTVTIDGRTAAGTGGYVDGTSLGLGVLFNFTQSGVVNSATINISNMHIELGRLGFFNFTGIRNTTITFRNCWFGETNKDGEAIGGVVDTQMAIFCWECGNNTYNLLGNKIQDVDGFFYSEREGRDSSGASTLNVRYNWSGGLRRHTPRGGTALRNIGFIMGWFGSLNGRMSENLFYSPGDTTEGVDLFSLNAFTGTTLLPVVITRNRMWGDDPGSTTNAAFQIGDGGSNTAYVYVTENTIIDWNTPAQISAGHNNKYSNNKAYTSEAYPGHVSGMIYQHWRYNVVPGNMHTNEVTNNTHLCYYDPDDGSEVRLGDIWFPNYGVNPFPTRNYPNEGQCDGTCDITDNKNPIGWSSNDWEHLAWAGGQGKSELWRAEWNSFRYAGSDGISPTIDYNSPWIGDGGSQDFTAVDISGSATYGDQSVVDDIQTHDVVILGAGGTIPYTVTSVSTTTPTIISVSVVSNQVLFTAVLAGSFTYQYTLTETDGATATGTISGTVVASATTSLHYDQDGEVYISIDVQAPHFNLPRNGYTWRPLGHTTAPDDTYMQCEPYSGSVLIGDVETEAAELIYRCYFDAAATYTVYVNGMAAGSSNYNSCWVGFNDNPDASHIQVATWVLPLDSADWHWDDGTTGGGSAIQITTAGAETHDFHIWVKKGGFALGKIVITSGAAPTGDGPAISPETLQ